MKIYNQAPSYITPDWQDNLTAPLDQDAVLRAIMHLFKPLYTPMIAGSPVSITDNTGNVITENDVAEKMLQCTGELIDTDAENFMREFFTQTMSDYDKRLNADRIFIAQANVKANCPPPSGSIFYIPDDLRDACRKYLANRNQMEAFLQCTESFVLPEPHIAVHFLSKPVFDDYKDYIKTFVQTMSTNISAGDLQKFNDFQSIDLKTLEGIILRASDMDGLDPYSFERVLLMGTLMFLKYPRGQNSGLIVPDLSELICPRSILFWISNSVPGHRKRH